MHVAEDEIDGPGDANHLPARSLDLRLLPRVRKVPGQVGWRKEDVRSQSSSTKAEGPLQGSDSR
jgi:hypothetical protein